MIRARHIAMMGLVAAGALAAPRLAAAECHDYVRRVYTAPVVVTYAEPAYRVVNYPVYAAPVYVEPVYVAPPVYTTYTRCYRPAVQVSVQRDCGYRRAYVDHRSFRSHRGWSAGVRVDTGRGGRGWEFNVSRHRYWIAIDDQSRWSRQETVCLWVRAGEGIRTIPSPVFLAGDWCAIAPAR